MPGIASNSTGLQAEQVSAWGPILVMLAMAIVFAAGMMVMSAVLNPRRPGKTKDSPYESGMAPTGEARGRFNVRYYLIALLFLLFDVEVVLLFPWAAVFGGDMAEYRTAVWLGDMLLFVAILLVGFIYARRREALRFD